LQRRFEGLFQLIHHRQPRFDFGDDGLLFFKGRKRNCSFT
jgi:hypothetical protein